MRIAHYFICSIALLAAAGCERSEGCCQPTGEGKVTIMRLCNDPALCGLSITAPPDFVLATVFIDGTNQGFLYPGNWTHSGWSTAVRSLVGIPRPPPDSAVGRFAVANGEHTVVLEKVGFEPIRRQINYLGKELVLDIRPADIVQAPEPPPN